MKTSKTRLRIGYIGVGLMGHGAAKNIVTKGYPLTVFDPYAKDNVRDLVERGATEAAPSPISQTSRTLFFCTFLLRRMSSRSSMAPAV